MTPKDKAKELVDKFTVVGLQQRNEGIQCAVIAVDELIMAHNKMKDFLFDEIGYLITTPDFWQKVKHEIENYDTKNI
jgi:hypothetical protein